MSEPKNPNWETCEVEGDDIDSVHCLTHDRHPGDCWDAREASIAALEAALERAGKELCAYKPPNECEKHGWLWAALPRSKGGAK